MPFTPASPKYTPYATHAPSTATPSVDGSTVGCSEPLHCPGPLIAALIRESDELAATACRIGQQFRRYMQLQAEFYNLPSMPITAHVPVAEYQQQLSAYYETHYPKASRPLAETRPAAKRPLSDFNFFCRDARKLVVDAHPDFTKEQVNRELGRIWSILDMQSRQYYRNLHVQDKQRYTQTQAGIPAHSIVVHRAMPTILDTSALRAASQARQTVWRCITASVPSNSIQSILNKALSPEASNKSDMDEPFANIVSPSN
ncbi:hypothetical protein IWW36_003216 [Coemansia brasiliensis]|uniref:HMG box domain-containing protein n=1 Tax=Coemansia brasiliensis TaxID=2650707 RepID=A0A9W8I6R9_9FUNG|nr:hypothetical protein IWW36_003216 [Coemansia brasiliensis]